jgi:hypothetical protein
MSECELSRVRTEFNQLRVLPIVARIAHAPEMPRDALCSKNTAAHQHANVPCGNKQTHGTHEKGHSDRDSVLSARSAKHDFNTNHPGEDTDRQGMAARFYGRYRFFILLIAAYLLMRLILLLVLKRWP